MSSIQTISRAKTQNLCYLYRKHFQHTLLRGTRVCRRVVPLTGGGPPVARPGDNRRLEEDDSSGRDQDNFRCYGHAGLLFVDTRVYFYGPLTKLSFLPQREVGTLLSYPQSPSLGLWSLGGSLPVLSRHPMKYPGQYYRKGLNILRGTK